LDAGQTISRADRRGRTAALLLEAHGPCDPLRRAELLDEVVALNGCVAVAIADRYRGSRLAVDDPRQSAREGLTKAVHRFDPTVGPDLLTYAVPIIRGAVQRCFGDQSWTIRPTRPFQELQWRANRRSDRLQQEFGPELTDQVWDDVEYSAEELENADLPRPSMAG
jgi:RNA polymerase sigma-B factor